MLDVKYLSACEIQLENQIDEIQQFLKKAPEGYLSCAKAGQKVRYYLKKFNSETKEKSGRNLRRSEMELVNIMASKGYFLKLLPFLNRELVMLKDLRKFISEQGKERVYSEMNEYRKALINPWYALEEDNAKKWMNFDYIPKEISEESKVIQTANGEWVRSKSEKIIADEFLRRGIPYRYESPLRLEGYSEPIYPDFTVFNKRIGKEYYLEHMGRIDDEAYYFNMLKRLRLYSKNGIYVGGRLLLTYELNHFAIDMNQLNYIIDSYLS